MTWAEGAAILGDIGEFVGSFAVLATLVYLTKQVREANRLATLTAVQANRAERRQFNLANRDSPYLPEILLKVEQGVPLEPVEVRRYRMHIATEYTLFYANWVNRDIGLMGAYAPPDDLYLEWWAQSPMYREWWQQFGRRLYPARFCDYVEAEFARRASEPAR